MFRPRFYQHSRARHLILVVLFLVTSLSWLSEANPVAGQEDGYWASDSCYYDAADVQLGCLYAEGEDVFYFENATQSWYLVVTEADGSWRYQPLSESSAGSYDCSRSVIAVSCNEQARQAEVNEGSWGDDDCYYDGAGNQLGCLTIYKSDVYYYEIATDRWYLTESDQGTSAQGTFDCSQNPIAVSCQELTRQADASEGFWGADDCYYDASGNQIGCLAVEGDQVFYYENASAVWYTLTAEDDGTWTYTSVRNEAAVDDALTAEEYVTSHVEALNNFWSERFTQNTRNFAGADVVLAEGPVTTSCSDDNGQPLVADEVSDWVFYCSVAQTIYFSPGVLRQISTNGVPVLLFYVGHEIGHHVQYRTDPQEYNARYCANPESYELQANCLSGVWIANLVNQGYLDASASDQIYNFALTLADDGIHGSAQDQAKQFWSGYQTGSC